VRQRVFLSFSYQSDARSVNPWRLNVNKTPAAEQTPPLKTWVLTGARPTTATQTKNEKKKRRWERRILPGGGVRGTVRGAAAAREPAAVAGEAPLLPAWTSAAGRGARIP
jgi:hypothetical protein